jgi:ketosteroid isomerase-like protein
MCGKRYPLARYCLAMPQEENIEIVRRAYGSLARRDWDGLWADAHPDFELQTQLQGSYRGREEAQRFVEDRIAAFESWKAQPEEFFESDDQVVVFVTQRAQPKGTNAVIEIKVEDVWTLRDGKVSTLETFPQREKALEAAGLSE